MDAKRLVDVTDGVYVHGLEERGEALREEAPRSLPLSRAHTHTHANEKTRT